MTAGALWTKSFPPAEVLLHGIMECFENIEVLMQDGIDLFEIQTPVDVNQNIAKSRQIREIEDERFRVSRSEKNCSRGMR